MLPSGFTIVAGSAVFNGTVGLMLGSMLGVGLVMVWGVVGFTFGAAVGAVVVLRPKRDDGRRAPDWGVEGPGGRRLTEAWRRSVRRLRQGIRAPRRNPRGGHPGGPETRQGQMD